MLAPWYIVYPLYVAVFTFVGWIAYLDDKRMKEHERIIKLRKKSDVDY